MGRIFPLRVSLKTIQNKALNHLHLVERIGGVAVARLWRSVIIVGLCFAAVVTMRIYLNKQVELAKAVNDSGLGSRGSEAIQ
jgi:hypothetical protein